MSRLIDADVLKEFIGRVRAEYDFFTDEERPRYEAHSKALELLNIYLDDAPTIEAVSVVHGEWTPCTKDGLALTELMRREGRKWYGYKCSNCNFIYKGNALLEFNFCPNCGAKMDGERKESE